jgi:hypothetical protein
MILYNNEYYIFHRCRLHSSSLSQFEQGILHHTHSVFFKKRYRSRPNGRVSKQSNATNNLYCWHYHLDEDRRNLNIE